ncbi:conserved exported hypothetical protein [mine drainage metagenome]|uniref:Periplasmic protein n=1 Tax=mine drainage metagenome TaxID=410659 RepID=A0A3P3ZLJ3_9ZZZZ
MKLHRKLTTGLICLVFSSGMATAADYNGNVNEQTHEMGCDEMGMKQGAMMTDLVATVHKHLGELKEKLNLTKDQEPAWKAFSDKVIEQAEKMVSMHRKMKGGTQSIPMTAPESMTMKADVMKDLAQNMALMANAVKTFYVTLTPEQKSIFDKSHMNYMKSMDYMK